MKMKVETKRNFLYALSIVTGLIILQNIRFLIFGKFLFSVCTLGLLFIFMSEFITTYTRHKKILKEHSLTEFAEDIHKHHTFQYVYLTICLFVLNVLFIYYSTILVINLMIIFISGFLFFNIFNEVKKTYLNDFIVSPNVAIIFDLTKSLIFFLATFVLTIRLINVENGYLYTALLLFIFHLFNVFFSSHHNVKLHALPILAIFGSLLTVGLYILLMAGTRVYNIMTIAGISSLMALVTTNIYHHEVEKSLNRDVIIEYLLITIFVLILILS